MRPNDRVYTGRTVSGSYTQYALALALEEQVHLLPAKVDFMQRWNLRVFGQAATLALLASVAGADAAEVEICTLVTKPSSFDRQTITFQGKVTAVKKTSSRRGNDYTLFKLQGPGACGTIDVFIWGHPKISDGDHVRVEGVFETVHHQDRSVFYNQVEAIKLVPLSK